MMKMKIVLILVLVSGFVFAQEKPVKENKMKMCESHSVADSTKKCNMKKMEKMDCCKDNKEMKNMKCEKKDTKASVKDEKCMMDMKAKVKEMKGMDMKGHDHSKMMRGSTHNDKGIIRTGVIDLNKIDENKDGFVYQDIMDWNVLSDTEGECPICGMKLKKFSLKEAKENLIKNGFEVK